MIDEEDLFDDTHIELNDIINNGAKYTLHYYVSNEPYKALHQELLLNEKTDCFDFSTLVPFIKIEKMLFIQHIFVKEEFRGNGIGSNLLYQIGLLAQESGIKFIFLVAKENSLLFSNLSFYERHGFKVVDGVSEYKNLLVKRL